MADLSLGGWRVTEVVRVNNVDKFVFLDGHTKKADALKHVTRLTLGFGDDAREVYAKGRTGQIVQG